MSDLAESVLQEYIYDLREPRSHLPRGQFEQRSYSIWAANEILQAIQRDRTASPITIVEEFICKMDKFSRINKDTGRIFSISYDIAQDILDLLLDTLIT